ncbi:MAG TPA: carbonic anhydrase [bacterium]|nr:carbonic anhydrase [bacterium]
MHTHSAETQATMTPAKAIQFLKEGNQRFLANLRANRDLQQQVAQTRQGQWPFAVVLGCIDSRAPAEIVFDQGIGDMFNVRIAGNFVTDEILGSLEFSCKIAGAKLIVVLGHTHCGAIKGACDGVELGHLTDMLAHLKPAVDAVEEPRDPALRTSQNAEFVQHVARENVERMIREIFARSEVLAEMLTKGEIDIIGAMYDIETGKVEFAERSALSSSR